MVTRKSIRGTEFYGANRRLAIVSLGSAALLCATLGTLGCDDGIDDGYDAADQAVDGEEQRFEVAEMEIAHSRIRFEAGPEAMELALTPNTQLLAADAVIVRDGEVLSLEEAEIELPYRGYVVGDADSWVRVRVGEDGFEGLIFKDQALWEVRADGAGETWMKRAAMGDYLDSPTHAQHECATGDAELAHATYVDTIATKSTAKAKSCAQVSMALLADYTHVAALGGAKASEAEMLTRLNEADGIFRADLNYGFSIKSVETFAKAGGPAFNTANTGTTPLVQLADYKQGKLPELGLAHLFVARTKSGTVGQAYVGTTCSSRHGSGVSNYLGKGKNSTIVVTHEIGHNFGSGHDDSGAAFVMAPSVNAKATEFSPFSQGQIDSHVASVSCFEPCAAADPELGSQPKPAALTCSGACGKKSAGGCWCDAQCSKYGDCCEDRAEVCQ